LAIARFSDSPLASASTIFLISTSSLHACSTRRCQDSSEMRDLTRIRSGVVGSLPTVDHKRIQRVNHLADRIA
jgi:hypothetical protein